MTTWPDKDAAAREGRDHVASADPTKLAKAIHEARAHHDLVLVSHHGGPLTGESPGDDQLAVARAAIEAGADAVFEHRARVPFGVGWISGHPVFYGLGNLVADEDPKDPWTGRSFLARIRFSPGSGQEVDACPYLIVDSEPKLLSGPGRPTQEGIFRRALGRLSVSSRRHRRRRGSRTSIQVHATRSGRGCASARPVSIGTTALRRRVRRCECGRRRRDS